MAKWLVRSPVTASLVGSRGCECKPPPGPRWRSNMVNFPVLYMSFEQTFLNTCSSYGFKKQLIIQTEITIENLWNYEVLDALYASCSCKLSTKRVMMELLHKFFNSKKFSSSDTIISPRSKQEFTDVCVHLFLVIL